MFFKHKIKMGEASESAKDENIHFREHFVLFGMLDNGQVPEPQ
jgi:hypothetical protein